MSNMTNHERTTIVEKLFGGYNLPETILANLGMEAVVVYLRGQKLPGVTVKPAGQDEQFDEFPLSGIDFD